MMKLEQKLRPDRSQVVTCEVTCNYAINLLYRDLLEDFQNDPYISIYVKGKFGAE